MNSKPTNHETRTDAPSGAPTCSASSDYRRGYSAGYAAGMKRQKKRAVEHEMALTLESLKAETGDGYTCAICRIQRPKTWYVYEIDVAGEWKNPCCAICARENKSRGPFP